MFQEAKHLISRYLAHVGACQAEVLLTIVYWAVVATTALALRLSRNHLLASSHSGANSYWIARPVLEKDIRSLTRQF